MWNDNNVWYSCACVTVMTEGRTFVGKVQKGESHQSGGRRCVVMGRER
jgi:hypothetical protein